MSGRYSQSQRRRDLSGLLIGSLAVVILILLGVALALNGMEPADPGVSTPPAASSTVPSTSQSGSTAPSTTLPSTAPTEPPARKLTTATISNVGDIIGHMRLVNSGLDPDTGIYNYDSCFRYMNDYIQSADYAVANLETTLYGPSWTWYDNGKKHTGYSGYPSFNSPDGLAESLKTAGFDMLLTANNHSYDTRSTGFHRTQQVIESLGLEHLGTISSQEETLWQVHNINGINIGMMCYTYQTGNLSNVRLNGIPVKSDDSKLIGTFSEDYLSAFYEEMEQNIAAMKAAGAEAVVLYIHWGIEYQRKESNTQNKIAQKMCDLGVDVIVGGHPHVVQPMEVLTSRQDPQKKTLCLYSMGNAFSNQQAEEASIPDNGYTEDGVMFTFTFAKYSDGTVIVEAADILPFWVDRTVISGRNGFAYHIFPLDDQVEDWQTQFEMSDVQYQGAQKSYNRTMKIVGEGLGQIQDYLRQLVLETETRLEIT